jgi:hypothetical protein
MKRIRIKSFKAIALLSLIALTISAPSCKKKTPEPAVEAVVTFVLGQATVSNPAPNDSPLHLKIKDILKTGAVITTGADSLVTIQINDVGVLRVTEKSIVELKDLFPDSRGTLIRLKSGSVFSKVIKKPDSNYQVQTATLTASVRGTEFLTSSIDGKGGIQVRNGIVAVKTPAMAEEKKVTAKQKAMIGDKGDILVTEQDRVQELTLEKLALHPYVENISAKTAEQINDEFKSVPVQEKKIEEEIHGLQDTLLDRLRKSGKP